MNIWHDISDKRISAASFEALIEIPKGCKAKYELDKETGLLRLDRVLYTSTVYPANYGFIPRTYAEDGDPMDVLVLCSEDISSMSLVRCYPIGHILMIDEGAEDIKVIAVPFKEPTWNVFRDVSDLPPHIVEEIKHFFGVYKQLEGKTMKVLQLFGRERTLEVISQAIEEYERRFPRS